VESGLSTYDELMMYKSLGANAFLVGTTLMKAPDIVPALQKLLGKKGPGAV
jgi:indole-3-glycerol phosphate synthase